MKRKILAFLGVAFLMATVLPAMAERSPKPSTADARVKTVTYHENDVYNVKAHYGYMMVIEFSPGEQIKTTESGDAAAWHIKRLERKNMLSIKPIEYNANTNLIVITTKRFYTFQLSAEKIASAAADPDASEPVPDDLTFRIKFVYADGDDDGVTNYDTGPEISENKISSTPAVKSMNFSYSYSGSKSLQPERAFDDGKFTYFQFNDLSVTPAIFSVDEKGNESLVNFTVQGDYLVVERVSRQFTLRDGEVWTCLFNEAYARPAGKENGKVSLGKIKEKKTASAKGKKNRQARNNVPEPPLLAIFKDFHPDTSTATYNH